MKYRIIVGLAAVSFFVLPVWVLGAGSAQKGSDIPKLERFGGGGKLEKPGKTSGESGEEEPLEKPKLTKPGKDWSNRVKTHSSRQRGKNFRNLARKIFKNQNRWR